MEEKMTLSELCKEVLELDKKATKAEWISEEWLHQDCATHMGYRIMNPPYESGDDIVAYTDPDKGNEDVYNAALIAHYRTACVKLALAAQRMEEALQLCVSTNQAQDHAMRALADVQKIVEGE